LALKKQLTLSLERTIDSSTSKPVLYEIVVTPMAAPSTPVEDLSYAGDKQSQEVLLRDSTNDVIFNLVPSDDPGLTERVLYRIAWRPKYMTGRIERHEFAMPDQDVNFADLSELDHLILGTSWLSESDIGVPGRVAGLNENGQVVDSQGNVLSANDAAVVQNNLNAEIVARQQADQQLQAQSDSQDIAQTTALTTLINTKNQQVLDANNAAIAIEKQARIVGDSGLQTQIANINLGSSQAVEALADDISDIQTILTHKADLVNGKVPSEQIPSVALGTATVVASRSEMLSLTQTQVQPGDLAVTPQGTYMLMGNDPSNLNSWVKTTTSSDVQSVNGQIGIVHLAASDVGARPAGTALAINEVTNLQSSLDAKTPLTSTAVLASRITNVENDSTIVKTQAPTNTVAKQVLPDNVVFVNSSDKLVHKDGTEVPLPGVSSTIPIASVTNLQASLDAKTDRATQDAINTNNSLTPTSNHGNRIGNIEGRVEDLESGGPGSGGTPTQKAVWWDNDSDTLNPAEVDLRSPWGINSSSQLYYTTGGAAEGERAYPYVTPSGHKKFVKVNEANPDSTDLAQLSHITNLQNQVNLKGSQASVDALTTAVTSKAPQSQVDGIASSVSTKAEGSTVTALQSDVANRALQSALDATNSQVALKVNTATYTPAVTALQNADTALGSRTTALEAQVPSKANLAGGRVPNSETSNTIPISYVVNLQSTLDNKAELTAGTLLVSQVPTGIPTSKVAGLDGSLALKADLIGGKIPTGQLPSAAISEVYPVSNRASMLALTTLQVQKGDVCVITSGSDSGSYILSADDPSLFSNWIKMPAPDDLVSSVNGRTGVVVLDAVAVGARPSNQALSISEVASLQATLDAKATTVALTAGLATKASPTDVANILDLSTPVKFAADLASTTAIASLTGQRTVDGTLTPLGSVCLVTAQASSVNNGLYVVNAGAWTRSPEMANSSSFVRNSMVIVKGGSANGPAIWQLTSSTGTTGTDPNSWTKSLAIQTPLVLTASLGVDKVGNDFRSKCVVGGGLSAVAGGIQIDRTVVPATFKGDVPSTGSSVITITHNLGTMDVASHFRDKSGGDAVLLGWRPTGVNTISAEFASPPASGQWRCLIWG
jgi:hypothetical protein